MGGPGPSRLSPGAQGSHLGSGENNGPHAALSWAVTVASRTAGLSPGQGHLRPRWADVSVRWSLALLGTWSLACWALDPRCGAYLIPTLPLPQVSDPSCRSATPGGAGTGAGPGGPPGGAALRRGPATGLEGPGRAQLGVPQHHPAGDQDVRTGFGAATHRSRGAQSLGHAEGQEVGGPQRALSLQGQEPCHARHSGTRKWLIRLSRCGCGLQINQRAAAPAAGQ